MQTSQFIYTENWLNGFFLLMVLTFNEIRNEWYPDFSSNIEQVQVNQLTEFFERSDNHKCSDDFRGNKSYLIHLNSSEI